MLKDEDVLTYLAENSDAPERDRSIHWDNEYKEFKVDVSGLLQGSNVLGNLSDKTGLQHRLAHWLLQYPFRRMGKDLETFRDNLANGYVIAERQDGRQFTLDILAQVLAISYIRQHLPHLDSNYFNVVIGDGYGVMTCLLNFTGAPKRTIIVNLNKPLLLDLIYFKKVFPDRKFILPRNQEEMHLAINAPDNPIIAVQADNAALIALAPITLAINIASMQEMLPDVIVKEVLCMTITCTG